MLKIKIITVGRVKEKWLNNALFEYEKRLSSILKFEWILTKEKLLPNFIDKETILLDSSGVELSSEEFADKIKELFQKYNSRLTFIIGGPLGFSKIPKTNLILSLSKLTFTHQITRLIFIEQIYRALTTSKNYRQKIN